MQLLTIENAEKILESGEIYRIGYNALNEGEFLYEHQEARPFSRKTKGSMGYSDEDRDQVNGINLIGKIKFIGRDDEWLDTINEEDSNFSMLSGVKLKDHNDDIRMAIGVITKWNGEPLFILDDYEKYQDIANVEINEMMLPKIY
jgi:hypothetical protein|tara:strand:- start:557 stop:991 length:435 start_codon:yes stop_codon:yes gene_type:complete